jgi:hypothetical protein
MAKIRHQKNQWLPLMQHHPQKKRLDTEVTASPAILTMCVPGHYNWIKKNQNIPAWLSKMLWPSIFAKCLEASEGTEKVCAPATREECNNYDLTTSPCFKRLADHNDWSRWFAISNLPPICACWRQIKRWSGSIWSRRWRPPAVAAVAMQAPRFTWLTVMPSPCRRG